MENPTATSCGAHRVRAIRIAILLAAFALGALCPGHAAAQITVTIDEFGGRDAPVSFDASTGQPISYAECAGDVAIPFELTNIPYDGSGVITVWRGASSAACETASSRSSTTTVCTLVGSADVTSDTATFDFGAQDVLGSSACEGSSSTLTLWFLYVDSSGDRSTDVDSTSAGSFSVTLDPVAPAAPVVADLPAGDTQITIVWDNPSSVETLYGANVYLDTAGCDAEGMLIESPLVAGAVAPSTVTPSLVTGRAVDEATVDGSALGLEYGEYAAVAVTLLDRALNESVLSNVVCAQRVELSGFFDAYCEERGLEVEACREQYGCAVPSAIGAIGRARGARSIAASGLVLGLASLLARRRAARRSSADNGSSGMPSR